MAIVASDVSGGDNDQIAPENSEKWLHGADSSKENFSLRSRSFFEGENRSSTVPDMLEIRRLRRQVSSGAHRSTFAGPDAHSV